MSLVLAGPRRIFVLLVFCENLGANRPGALSPRLDLPGGWLDANGAEPHDGAAARVRRLHWTVGGWLVGATVFVIERGHARGDRVNPR